jgi:UDP-glucuronate decarboxylase
MRVLVTGGGGFIGRAVCERLRALGAQVLAPRRAELDLLCADAAAAYVQQSRPSHLVHLAWTTMPGRYWDDLANHAWVAASFALLRAFAAAGGKVAFFAGSCAEYDWQHGALDEALTPLRAATRYGRCKAALGQSALPLAAALGLRLAWGRIHFPYGPGERAERLVPQLACRLLAGVEAATGPAEVARDFIHVADLADAIVCLLQAGHHGALDLCTGQATEVGRIARCIAQSTGNEHLLRLGALPPRAGEPTRLTSTPRTLRGLGWAPRVGLDEGLRQCVREWRWRLQAEATSGA